MSRCLLGAAMALIAAAPASGAAAAPAAIALSATPSDQIARVLVPTVARARPGAGPVRVRLRPSGGHTGGPTQLRVTGRAVVSGSEYLQVILPVRPNGARGWVSADALRVHRTPFQVRVDRASRSLVVTRAGRVVKRSRAVIGKPATPTPAGSFAITEIVRQPGNGGFYGPYVLTLTAHSDVLERFQGGPGLVAIHGRGGGSLRDGLGSARSHGCIRIPNTLIVWMARNLEPGVPVIVR